MVSVFLIAAVVVLITLIYPLLCKPWNFPPGPTGLPILGYAVFLNPKKIYETYTDLYERYGPVVGVKLGLRNVVLINGWKAVHEALMNEDLSHRPVFQVSVELYPGEQQGVLLCNGETWKHQRRFTLHHFRNLGFGKRSHESVISEEANYLVDQMLLNKDNPMDVKVPVGVSSINMLWAIISGKRHDHNDPKLIRIVNCVIRGLRSGMITGGLLNSFTFLRFIAPDYLGYTNLRQAFEDIKGFVKETVDEHLKTFDPNEIRDFIDIYISEMKKEEKHQSFNEKQLIALVGDLFTAGTETSSSVTSFAVLFLCKYPDLQQQLQDTLDEVVGRGNIVTLDHRPKLVLIDAFLNECLRFRGPLPVTIPHYAVRDTKVQDHFIPRGSRVHINLYSVSMDADYWKDPENFRPSRFIDDQGKMHKTERLIPFGKGKRSCLGEALARMTGFLILATIVHRLKFRFADGHDPSTEGVTGFTMTAENFNVMVTERK